MFLIAFPCGFGGNSEERESKTVQKMAQIKERGGCEEELSMLCIFIRK